MHTETHNNRYCTVNNDIFTTGDIVNLTFIYLRKMNWKPLNCRCTVLLRSSSRLSLRYGNLRLYIGWFLVLQLQACYLSSLRKCQRRGMAPLLSTLAKTFCFPFPLVLLQLISLRRGSGKLFISYLTVIHNLPGNYHDTINHPHGQLLEKSCFCPIVWKSLVLCPPSLVTWPLDSSPLDCSLFILAI